MPVSIEAHVLRLQRQLGNQRVARELRGDRVCDEAKRSTRLLLVESSRVQRQHTESRAVAGEAGMAFAGYRAEEGWAFLTGPSGAAGHRWNEPGFDGVAFRTRGDLQIDIVDNKSWASPRRVGSSSALTRNLLHNLDDLITAANGSAFDDVPRIAQVRSRLAATRAAVAAGHPIPPDVRLVVTNFGGRSSGITARLSGLGVTFRDLMAAPSTAGGAATGGAAAGTGGSAPPGATGGTGAQSAVPPSTGAQAPAEATDATRAVAREVAREAATEMRLLRAARVLRVGVQIFQFVSSLQLLAEFTSMASSGLAGRGFVLAREVAQARELERKAREFQRDYQPFSERVGASTWRLFGAAADPVAAGQVAGSLGDILLPLEDFERELTAQLQRIRAALGEVRARRAAIAAILDDPGASRAIAVATFGTAELARLVGAQDDFMHIEGNLERAESAFQGALGSIVVDLQTLRHWDGYLFGICAQAGACGTWSLQVPFLGTSTVRFLPAAAEETGE